MVCEVGLVVGVLVVVGDCRLVGLGLVLENVASESIPRPFRPPFWHREVSAGTQ